MAAFPQARPFAYNLDDFIEAAIDIDPDRVPLFENEEAARVAGLEPGDVFKTPGGHMGLVGVLPIDGRE